MPDFNAPPFDALTPDERASRFVAATPVRAHAVAGPAILRLICAQSATHKALSA